MKIYFPISTDFDSEQLHELYDSLSDLSNNEVSLEFIKREFELSKGQQHLYGDTAVEALLFSLGTMSFYEFIFKPVGKRIGQKLKEILYSNRGSGMEISIIIDDKPLVINYKKLEKTGFENLLMESLLLHHVRILSKDEAKRYNSQIAKGEALNVVNILFYQTEKISESHHQQAILIRNSIIKHTANLKEDKINYDTFIYEMSVINMALLEFIKNITAP